MMADESSKMTELGMFRAALNRAIEQNGLGEQLRTHQATKMWADVAGSMVASVSEAVSVSNKVLYVKTKSSVWAQELTFQKTEILSRLNSKLGGQVIEDIRFSTTGSRSKRTKRQEPVQVTPRNLSEEIGENTPLPESDEARIKALIQRSRTVLQWKREHNWIPCRRCGVLLDPKEKIARGKNEKRNDNWLCKMCQMTLSDVIS